MIKCGKRSLAWSVSIISFVFMFVPEDVFKRITLFPKLSVENNLLINQIAVVNGTIGVNWKELKGYKEGDDKKIVNFVS